MEVLSNIQSQFQDTMLALHGSVAQAGLSLLTFTLALQLIVILVEGIFQKALLGTFETFARLIITGGIFGGLIRGVPTIIEQVLSFFAGAAGGAPMAQMNPTAVLETGGTAARELIAGGGILDKVFLGFLGLLIVILFVLIALALLMALLESYFVGIGAAITFGLGGLQLSRDIAIAGFKMILGVGMKLFIMGIVVAIVGGSVNDLVQTFSEEGGFDIGNALWVIAAAMFGAGIMWTIPRMSQMMITGHGSMGLTQGLMSATQFAAAAMTGLAGAVASGVKSGIGAAKLTNAAVSSVKQDAANADAGPLRVAASSAGVAARAIAASKQARLDGTGPRHGSLLWNAATNTNRATAAATEFAEKQREEARQRAQERREGVAGQSRKQVASGVRAASQERRDEMQKARVTAQRSGSVPSTRVKDDGKQQRRDEEQERREKVAQDSRRQVASSVRAAAQEKREEVQKARTLASRSRNVSQKDAAVSEQKRIHEDEQKRRDISVRTAAQSKRNELERAAIVQRSGSVPNTRGQDSRGNAPRYDNRGSKR